MPAPDPVTRSQPIEKEQLDDLATYANEKSKLGGQPYAFGAIDGDDPGWKTELDRLRRNIFDQNFSLNPAYSGVVNVGALQATDYTVLNEDWFISSASKRCLVEGIRFISDNGLATVASLSSKKTISDSSHFYFYRNQNFSLSSNETVRELDSASSGNVLFRSAKDVDYIFPEPDISGPMEVTTTLHLNKSRWFWGCDANPTTPSEFSNPLFFARNHSELVWTLAVDVPEGATCRGRFRIPFGLASGVVPGLEATGPFASHITITGSGSSRTVEWEFAWGIQDEFQLGLRLNNHNGDAGSPSACYFTTDNPPGTDFNLGVWGFMEWEFKSFAEEHPAIHGTKACYKIEIPNCSVKHSSASIDTNASHQRAIKNQSGSVTQFITYSSHNLGRIMHVPSSDISADGFFVGRTFPIRSADLNPLASTSPISFALNDSARLGSTVFSTADVKAVTPAVDPVLPSYPVRHISAAASEQGQSLIPAGTVIFKVNISKQPVPSSANPDIYDYPPIAGDYCTIGFMRGETFVELETVEMNVSEKEIYPDWWIVTPEQLVYQTNSGKRMLVQANVIANNSTRTTYPLAVFFAEEKFLKFPLLAEHYNDALAGLNLLE